MFINRKFISIYVHKGESPIMQEARWVELALSAAKHIPFSSTKIAAAAA